MKGIMKLAVPAAVALAVAGTSGLAVAAQDKERMSKDWPTFRKADSDNSGAISQDEARSVQGLGTNFSQYDKNNDGQLSRSEYESAKKAAKSGDKQSGASGSTQRSGKSEEQSGAGGSSAGKSSSGAAGATGSRPADRGPLPTTPGSGASGSGSGGGSQ